MSDPSNMSSSSKELLQKVRMIVPPLLEKFHKGQLGRVAVIGGSESYTGAPYFSAMASAKLGADLSHVFCTPPAAAVIKTYSPNLMVHPNMRESSETLNNSDATSESEIASPIIAMLSSLHALVIGPGLGRDKLMQATVATVIKAAREKNTPLVLDADALWLIQNQPDLVKGYQECILTPNVVEFGRLVKALHLGEDEIPDSGEAGCKKLAQAMGGLVVVRKGAVDWISNGDEAVVDDGEGGRKRSGGQGDTLTGSIGTLLAWREAYHQGLWDIEGSFNRRETLLLAAWGGSAITRECSRLAFGKHGRSMQASDLTEEVHVAFETLIGEKKESNVPKL